MERSILTAVLVLVLSRGIAQLPITNDYHTDSTIRRLKTERHFVYVPDSTWFYAHHASITHFKDKFIALWSNGMIDEDKPGQRVVFSVSTDFVHWSRPAVLAQPGSEILTAAGFHQFSDTLVAYYGEYTDHRTHTHLWARTSTDGEHWAEARDMHIPVNPNHGPQAISGGRLIISGNFTYPYTDDYRGLSGWKLNSFYPDSAYREDNPATFYSPAEMYGLPPLCETSFYQTDDGTLHALLRVTGKGWKGLLWQTESKDNGRSWSWPAPSQFTDNDSKFHFGRLPDGRFYYVGIPDTLHHYARTPLVLSTSQDGQHFNHNYILADEPYTIKKAGLWKGGQYGYPHTMVYGHYLYIIVSRQKEAIETLRVNLRDIR